MKVSATRFSVELPDYVFDDRSDPDDSDDEINRNDDNENNDDNYYI